MDLWLVQGWGELNPSAGEARVITGGARDTRCGANGLSFFTSGALTPRLGDGLMPSYRFGSGLVPGEEFFDAVLWSPKQIHTLLMGHASISLHH